MRTADLNDLLTVIHSFSYLSMVREGQKFFENLKIIMVSMKWFMVGG